MVRLLLMYLCCVVVLTLAGCFYQQLGNNLERVMHRYNCVRIKLIGAVNQHWSEGLSVDDKW